MAASAKYMPLAGVRRLAMLAFICLVDAFTVSPAAISRVRLLVAHRCATSIRMEEKPKSLSQVCTLDHL